MPPCGRGVILQNLQDNTPGESVSAGRKHNRGNGIRRDCPVQRSARYHARRVIIKTVEIQVRRFSRHGKIHQTEVLVERVSSYPRLP